MSDVFVPYGGLHLAVVAVCAVLIATIAFVGRRLHGSTAEPHVRKALAAFALCFWIAYNVWWNWGGIDLFISLPLQPCDLAGLVAPLTLLSQRRWLRATLYFWAFAFTVQAFIQPTLTAGPGLLTFWAFWTAHVLVMACAAYDVTVLGFRPGWGDFNRAVVVSVVYLLLILPVNGWLGSNYGFVGNPPPGRKIPPLVEAFGPWPERVAVMAGLAFLGFLLLLAPWLWTARQRQTAARRP